MSSRAITFAVLLAISGSPAAAGLVYDNGPLNITNGFGGTSITNARVADNFVLGSPASVSAVRFWLQPAENTQGVFSGTISYAIYQDSAGALGTPPLASGSANPAVSVVPIGVFNNFVQLDLSLASPVALAAGTYWLELHEGPTLTTNDGTLIHWVKRNVPSGDSKENLVPSLPTTSQNAEMGFQLFDSSVPEPSTVVLAAVGILMLVRRNRLRGCVR